MAQRRKRKKISKKTWKKWSQSFQKAKTTTGKISVILCGVVMILIAFIGTRETFGWPVPSWEQIFRSVGLQKEMTALVESQGASTRIHFIDVGQGDATLLEHENIFALVDAGTPASAVALQDYLHDVGVTELEYLVMTHPHTDHIGGMVQILENFEVHSLLLPNLSKEIVQERKGLQKILKLANEKKVPMKVMQTADTYFLSDAKIEVLQKSVENHEINDLSPILRFETQHLSCLLTGDGESAVENLALSSHLRLKSDIFQAGHHGSYTSNSRAFVQAVQPKAVVISLGKDNDYGHPHEAPMRAFQSVFAQVYRTDQQGTIIAYVNQNNQIQFASEVTTSTKAA